MNAKRLVQVVEDLKSDLGEGLVATDIWLTDEGQSLAGFNSQPKATAFFDEITRYLARALAGSKFPGLGKYYFITLENNMVIVVLNLGSIQQGMMVDSSKVTLGMVINVAAPRAIAGLEEALK